MTISNKANAVRVGRLWAEGLWKTYMGEDRCARIDLLREAIKREANPSLYWLGENLISCGVWFMHELVLKHGVKNWRKQFD